MKGAPYLLLGKSIWNIPLITNIVLAKNKYDVISSQELEDFMLLLLTYEHR